MEIVNHVSLMEVEITKETQQESGEWDTGEEAENVDIGDLDLEGI